MNDRLSFVEVLRRPLASAGSRESAALLVSAATLIVTVVTSLLVFHGRALPISGPGSIGQFAAIGSAVTAIVVFIAARSLDRIQPAEGVPRERMRWFDIAALSIAHGVIALLGWIAIADVVERSFTGAEVFPLAGALLAGAAMACTAYIVALSAATMTPATLSVVLMLFLVVGAFASMLSASDEQWWKLHLSSLGVTDDLSALTFNVTLIIAGIIVTTVAHFGTATIPVASPRAARGRRIVRLELTMMGLLLCGVGVFPVDRFLALHNLCATGMVVVFITMVIGLRRTVPGTSQVFVTMGYVFVACIIVLAVFFATGYYNLTAVELVAFLIIFTWLLLFLRNTEQTPATTRVPSP